MTRCRRCQRELKDPAAAARGIGKTCAVKEARENAIVGGKPRPVVNFLSARPNGSRTWLYRCDGARAMVRVFVVDGKRIFKCECLKNYFGDDLSTGRTLADGCDHIQAIAAFDDERFKKK